MRGWTVPALLLGLAVLMAGLALRPPPPHPVQAYLGGFSAARAMADVRAIAQRPHPIGSPEAARVQDYLFRRMTELGLSPEFRPFAAPAGAGRNLLGVLPGRSRTAPAVLLMAHSDSVAAGPGAGDDAAGVAAVLEAVRALKVTGPTERDVMVLITDGEEQGLLGARVFFRSDPARSHVGVAINLEARGNRGRALMFETNRDAGPLVGMLTDMNALAAASSLMPDLYRRLPNDTDLTEALKAGVQGLNFAFFAGLEDYHRATDTADRLDPGSLQHIGEQALRAAAALAHVRVLPGRGPDQTYVDVVGGPVIQYPNAGGWALLLLAVAGLAACALQARREGGGSLRGELLGAAAFLALAWALTGALWALGEIRVALAGHRLAPLLRQSDAAMAGAALLASGLALFWYAEAARRLRPESLRFGALHVLTLTAIGLQAFAPLDAFLITWPLLAVVVGFVLARPDRPWMAWLVILAALTEVLYWTGLMFDLVGQVTPVALAPFLAIAVAVALPILPPPERRTGRAGLLLAGLGVAVSLAALQT